jgi:tyrosine-protein kinase Etk/Wzc
MVEKSNPDSQAKGRPLDEMVALHDHTGLSQASGERECPRNSDSDAGLIEIVAKIWISRWTVVVMTAVAAVVGVIVALSLQVLFKSEVMALPPQPKKGAGGASLSQYSDLAAMAGIALPGGDGGSVDEITAILDSRTLRQKIIAMFGLKDFYRKKNDDDALKAFSKFFTTKNDKKTNRITISFQHTDAKIAADVCNAAAVALQEQFNDIHQSSSKRERAFLEGRLKLAEAESLEASDKFALFQKENGTVELESQTKATVEAIGTLQGQLIAEQVELRSLLASAVNPDNPQVQLLQQKVEELTKVLTRMSGSGDQGGVLIGLGRVPELGAKYLNLFRNVKKTEAMVVTLMAQTESARISEVRNAEVISIIDEAVPAQRRVSPNRSAIAIGVTIFGFFIGLTWAVMRDSLMDMNLPLRIRERIKVSDGKVSATSNREISQSRS